jgi:acyl-CoA thioesterase-1
MILALVNLFSAGGTMTSRAAGASGPVRIVAFGDSLTAGYMLTPAEAFPAQLEKALEGKGHDVEIANAGVSGDTSAGGRQRLDWSVPEGTEAVILELGSNDALRGIDPSLVKESLDDIVKRLKARGVEILIAGMSAPENWGKDYADRFNAIYGDLAERYDLILYPFFLDGVALTPELNLPDGLHPTGKGISIIVERILPDAETLVGRVLARRNGAVTSR